MWTIQRDGTLQFPPHHRPAAILWTGALSSLFTVWRKQCWWLSVANNWNIASNTSLTTVLEWMSFPSDCWRGMWLQLRAVFSDHSQRWLLWGPLPCLYQGYWWARPMGATGKDKRNLQEPEEEKHIIYIINLKLLFTFRKKNINPSIKRKPRKRRKTTVSQNYRKMTLYLSSLP